MDLLLNLLLCLLRLCFCGSLAFAWSRIFLVCSPGRLLCFAGIVEDVDLRCLASRTCFEMARTTYIKLPPLDVLAGVFVCDDNHQLGDLGLDHPLVELGHDFFDIGFDLIVL